MAPRDVSKTSYRIARFAQNRHIHNGVLEAKIFDNTGNCDTLTSGQVVSSEKLSQQTSVKCHVS